MSFNPLEAVVKKQIDRVDFGFYSDAEVRQRSICEVTSPVAIDTSVSASTPLPNGLYDPRMGPPTATDPPCITCGCRFLTCPGHAGHVELVVPVAHPLLWDKIVLLLRIKCWHCHKLRAPPRLLQIFRLKLRLLVEQGDYMKALKVDDWLAAAAKERMSSKPGATSAHVVGRALDQAIQELMETLSSITVEGNASIHKQNTLVESLRLRLVQELLSTCKSSPSCPHCGAHSPKIRQDSSNKIFQSPLTEAAKRIHEAEGIEMKTALEQIHKKDAEMTSSRDSRPEVRDMEVDDDKDHQGGSDDEEDGSVEQKKDSGRDLYMHAEEVKAQVELTWKTDDFLCRQLFSVQGHQVFFLQAVPVPPNRFRPPMHLGGMVVEHSQNMYLSKIILANEAVRTSFANHASSEAQGYKNWIELQTLVNCFMDSSKDPSNGQNVQPGIRQLLERKEGIFRKHMMGKRVDYACRSVISPDPYVGTNEIGIPRHFAENLTYPTPVTDINIQEMRRMVERGPKVYPGARWVQLPDRRVDLGKMDRHAREAIAARLLTHLAKGGKPAVVGRQLRDGDMVLMNRQPTLHKPGIMAHRVRVLHNPTQKTIRMHYANCNTYNADFDGDEMNCHFPQSDLGRAEAENIARTDLQFIVPTDGSPLRGLIQDHVVGGVKLTKKDTFLEKWEYQQLLFAALASLPGLELIQSSADIELMPPTLLKPRQLWTGKQVITTLLHHLRKKNDREGSSTTSLPGISTERKTKTPAAAFGTAQEEHLVLIRDGELLRGVLDKAAFGATDFSLVHAVHEAYGPERAGLLLNSFGRLFTAYIQYYSGHSCRMEDLMLTQDADKARRDLVQRAYNIGARTARAWADSEGGKVAFDTEDLPNSKLKPVEAASAASKVRDLLSSNEGKLNSASLDSVMMSKLNPLASEIVKKCLPDGLEVPFPTNTFGIMVTTGAKGSIVNQSQVSCALGQQALEGRRVPRLSSGRTLPSFAPFDINPRADGFVMDRFLTGIRPQEYYFHCMAGREGLVDTAVKTSRSGYLQRCLVKHLEELKVCYDYTVRSGEGNVVQFLYGEDGLDPTKACYLDCSEKSFAYMARNLSSMKFQNKALPGSSLGPAVEASEQKNQKVGCFKVGDSVKSRRLRVGSEWKRGALCVGWFAGTVKKVHDNGHLDIQYSDGQVINQVPIDIDFGGRHGLLSSKTTLVEHMTPDPLISRWSAGCRLGTDGSCVSERVATAANDALEKSSQVQTALKSVRAAGDDFGAMVAAKFGSAICAPGEAVGSIAAQSIGEPSTQMTLNTFHLAGAGANVTLGIPRLREIIMTASRELKTPTMSVPLSPSFSDREAVRLTRSFKRLTLNELIAGHRGIVVKESLVCNDAGIWERAYSVSLTFHPAERIKEAFGITLADVADVVGRNLVPALANQMRLELRKSTTGDEGYATVEGGESSQYVHNATDETEAEHDAPGKEADVLGESDEEESDDDDEVGEEDGVNALRRKQAASDDESESGSEQVGQNDDDSSDGQGTGIVRDTSPSDSPLPSPKGYKKDPKSFIGDSGVRVDFKKNCVHLQPLRVDPATRPLLMVGLVQIAASKTVVRSKAGVTEAYINDADGSGRCLQTAGVNFGEIWKLDGVDHTKLMSNDIWAVRCAYGVEAARGNIVDQIRHVFGAYGIEVNPRHLSLIADYMTFSGEFTPMNRIGMKNTCSPFLQMSFETTAQFLTQAALTGIHDALNSPSANIVLGRPVRHGTGAFSLLAK